MPPASNPNVELYLLVSIIAVFFLILLFVKLALFFDDFSKEMKYLNNEIRRTDGAEREYWLCQRRKLWLSLIPFIKY